MHGNGFFARLGRSAHLFTLCILLESGIFAQVVPESRILNGTVYYAEGNKLAENVRVELRTTEGNLVTSTETNSDGWFEFRGLARAPYVVMINVTGFERVNVDFDLAFTSSRGNVFYLKQRSDDKAKLPSAHSVSMHELSMPQKARELVESGKKKLYADKNAEGGLQDFQQAIATAPGYYEAYYQAGMADITLGRKRKAAEDFEKAKELSGDAYGEAEIGLGALLLDDAEFAAGEKAIRRGLELNPNAWLGHYELGRAFLNENRIDLAEKSGIEARSLAPNAPIVYRLLCNVHLRQNNYAALLEDLDAYLRLDSDSPAGIRAKELREQVRQKINASRSEAPAGSAPKPNEKMPP
jgi:tetratricopeptide (TPR) repeat protein